VKRVWACLPQTLFNLKGKHKICLSFHSGKHALARHWQKDQLVQEECASLFKEALFGLHEVY
jgi:hypothetical protein